MVRKSSRIWPQHFPILMSTFFHMCSGVLCTPNSQDLSLKTARRVHDHLHENLTLSQRSIPHRSESQELSGVWIFLHQGIDICFLQAGWKSRDSSLDNYRQSVPSVAHYLQQDWIWWRTSQPVNEVRFDEIQPVDATWTKTSDHTSCWVQGKCGHQKGKKYGKINHIFSMLVSMKTQWYAWHFPVKEIIWIPTQVKI